MVVRTLDEGCVEMVVHLMLQEPITLLWTYVGLNGTNAAIMEIKVIFFIGLISACFYLTRFINPTMENILISLQHHHRDLIRVQ